MSQKYKFSGHMGFFDASVKQNSAFFNIKLIVVSSREVAEMWFGNALQSQNLDNLLSLKEIKFTFWQIILQKNIRLSNCQVKCNVVL